MDRVLTATTMEWIWCGLDHCPEFMDGVQPDATKEIMVKSGWRVTKKQLLGIMIHSPKFFDKTHFNINVI